MFSPVFIFLGSQLLFTLIFGLLRLEDTQTLQRALLREQNAQGTRLERYLRFLAASRTIQRAGNNRTIAVLFLTLGGISLVFPVLYLIGPNPTLSGSFQILQIEQLVVLALVIGLIGGIVTEAGFRFLKVELKAWHLFESSAASPPSTSNKRTLNTGIINLLILVLACEGLAAAIMMSGNLTLAFLLFGTVITFAILLLPTVVLDRPVRSLPALEDTSWSALAPRIATWAQLANVEYEAVRLWQGFPGTLGYGVWYSARHPQRRVLILNEIFLRHTEWRQQDAMVATLLCQLRLAQSQHLLLRRVLSVPVFWMSIACLPFLQIWLFPITGPSTLVPELIFFLSLMAISGSLRSFPPQAIFTLDRLSAFLTGDPLAVMVNMKLRDALSGQPEVKPSNPSRQKQQRTPPSTDQRMLKLAEVMRQEWPRAPQTGDPVPAIITVYAGPHLITAPFDQATSALPVPASPYGGKDLFHQQ